MLASKKSTLESAFHDKGFKTSSKIHDLRKQIEFYFGDPNLARDRWMRNLISQHEKGYVPVDTLFSFNKINAIMFDSDFSSLKDKRRAMLEAIKKSELLKLNKSGDLVKRRIPFDASLPHNRQFRAEVDTRMIYIENLPTFTSHDLLAEILLKNDPEAAVLHISLPRFQTKQIKGFAFIELKVRPKQSLRTNDR